jgi:alcohol dehydrogenase (cytochrome c)
VIFSRSMHAAARLYRFNTGGPMGGGILTYEVGGRQYTAAASGSPSGFWVDKNGGAPTIVVFALPQQRSMN